MVAFNKCENVIKMVSMQLETCFLLFLSDIKYRNSNVRKRIKSHFDIYRLLFLQGRSPSLHPTEGKIREKLVGFDKML